MKRWERILSTVSPSPCSGSICYQYNGIADLTGPGECPSIFTSNVIFAGVQTCGPPTLSPAKKESCAFCGSSVRSRSLINALSVELFQESLLLPEFPKLKSLRGLGISDKAEYAEQLEHKFDYRNTFYDRPPLLDLMNPPSSEFGKYDFVIASDVLEHVSPPAQTGFPNIRKLLRPGGVAIMTVPYSVEAVGTAERFPQLNQYCVSAIGGRAVLVNRTVAGEFQVFDELVFHLAASPSLEMREFSETGLRELLAELSYGAPRWHGESYESYGIVWPEPWSLPFALRKGEPSFSAATIRELVKELKVARLEAAVQKASLDHMNRRRWTRMGRAVKLL